LDHRSGFNNLSPAVIEIRPGSINFPDISPNSAILASEREMDHPRDLRFGPIPLLVPVCLLFVLGFLGGSGSLDTRAEATEKTVRAKQIDYNTKIPSAKPGRNYAYFFISRKGNRVASSLVGFCGEFNSGWVRIRGNRFRMEKTWNNGYGMKFTGKFSKKRKVVRGIVKVWGPTKKKCNSGDRKFSGKKF